MGEDYALFVVACLSSLTRAVFHDHPDQILCYYHLVQPSNVRVHKLSVVVYLAREVGVIFLC